ncbi:hypothetical protein [Kistimonas scapharcae]|uniref:hypothetical protein n=1 Tax=Kistimonas scapharcae TaxID=1036133 RepID=UPI0031ECC347
MARSRWPELEKLASEGKSIKEIAEAAGIHYGTAKQTLSAIRKAGGASKPKAEKLTPVQEHQLKRQNKHLAGQLEELAERYERDNRLAGLLAEMRQQELKPPAWAMPGTSQSGHQIACTVLSDCHYDEVVNPEEVAFTNAYNRQIAELRTRTYFDNVCRLHDDVGVPLDGLVLCLAGDMVSGNIHEELAQSNDAHIMNTVVHWSEQLSAGVALLADTFGKVHVPCVTGNHGRNTRKPRNKGRAEDNFDWLIYKLIEREFRNDPRVTFQIPNNSDCRFNIFSTRYQLSHGDQFRGGNGIAGIFSPIMRGDHQKRKRETSINTPYDVLIMGHWHQLLDMRRVVVNGSLKGYDEYAYANNFDFQPPEQAFWLTHPKYGKTITAPVRVISDRERALWPQSNDVSANWMNGAA